MRNEGEKSSRLPKLVTKGLTDKVIKGKKTEEQLFRDMWKKNYRDRKQKTACKTEVQNAWYRQRNLEQMTDRVGEMIIEKGKDGEGGKNNECCRFFF